MNFHGPATLKLIIWFCECAYIYRHAPTLNYFIQPSFKAAARDPFHLTVVDTCELSPVCTFVPVLWWWWWGEGGGQSCRCGSPNEYIRINVATVVAVSSAHSGVPLTTRGNHLQWTSTREMTVLWVNGNSGAQPERNKGRSRGASAVVAGCNVMFRSIAAGRDWKDDQTMLQLLFLSDHIDHQQVLYHTGETDRTEVKSVSVSHSVKRFHCIPFHSRPPPGICGKLVHT